MKQINRWGISAGLVALVGMAVFAASCSDDKKGSTGGGGAASTGGATSDTGGAGADVGGGAATGGSTSTSTQATGGGGNDSDSGTVLGCTSANTDLARSDGLIADFVGSGADAGIEVIGGIATYSGDAAPEATISGGALHIVSDAPQTSAAQYVGTVIYFNDCVDASAFTGVEFTISGTMTGCTLQYSTNHSAANDMTTDPKGTCDLGAGKCYSPQKAVTLTDTETVVQVPWTGATGGSPSVAVDPSKLTGVQWQFTIASGTAACAANITIKNVKFYK